MHCTTAAVIEEESASPAPWFWYSGQRSDPFAFATAKGTKKPKKKLSQKYGSAEKRVLDCLSRYANASGEVWLSVPTVARIADCSDRTVQRALDRLCAAGHLVDTGKRSGHKYKNTRVYVLRMSPNIETVEIDQSICLSSIEESFCSSSNNAYKPAHEATLPCEQEEKSAQAEAKATPLVPTGLGPPSSSAWFPPKSKPWPTVLTCAHHQQALTAEAIGKRDSKLVKRWKTENKKAGFGMPTITGPEGFQLRQATRGKTALAYVEFRDLVLPCVIAHWKAYTGFCRTRLVHFRKAPFPAEPSIGFLLRYKALAKEFYEKVKDEALPPEKSFLKNFLWTCLNHGKPKAGPLPKNIPTPRKPKRWNTPIWSDHPLEHKKLTFEEMHAPSTWNGTTEAETLQKLVQKGVLKDHAMAVMNCVRHYWSDFAMTVKVETGAVIHANPHPHWLLEHWSVADDLDRFYAELKKKVGFKKKTTFIPAAVPAAGFEEKTTFSFKKKTSFMAACI